MRLYRLGILVCIVAAAGGCQSPETAARPVEPAPIVRVVPQDLPETSRGGSSSRPHVESDESSEASVRRMITAAVPSESSRTPATAAGRTAPKTPDRAPLGNPSFAAAEIGRGAGRIRSIRQTQHEQADIPEPEPLPEVNGPASPLGVAEDDAKLDIDAEPVPAVAQPDDRYPITLSTALHLAGSSNLQVALAQERVREAYARLDGAKVLWVPNISGGLGFNDHAGQLQNIEGQILEINRQSLFVGGGAGFGRTPLAGGANPPPRMGIDLSPVDVIFEPLAARQRANRARFDVSVAFNDTLLNVSYVYLELVRAQSQVAIAREAIANTAALERITSDFARTGLGLEADAQRARGDLAERRRELLSGEERVRVTSAELARKSQPVPIELISEQVALDSLIAQGLRARPEISRENAQVESIDSRIAQERWRPWVPNLHVGVGGGTFGGGRNDNFGDFSGRYDLDALAVWEVRTSDLATVHLFVNVRVSIGRPASTISRGAIESVRKWRLPTIRPLCAENRSSLPNSRLQQQPTHCRSISTASAAASSVRLKLSRQSRRWHWRGTAMSTQSWTTIRPNWRCGGQSVILPTRRRRWRLPVPQRPLRLPLSSEQQSRPLRKAAIDAT